MLKHTKTNREVDVNSLSPGSASELHDGAASTTSSRHHPHQAQCVSSRFMSFHEAECDVPSPAKRSMSAILLASNASHGI